jgi:hypothetical protein
MFAHPLEPFWLGSILQRMRLLDYDRYIADFRLMADLALAGTHCLDHHAAN